MCHVWVLVLLLDTQLIENINETLRYICVNQMYCMDMIRFINQRKIGENYFINDIINWVCQEEQIFN